MPSLFPRPGIHCVFLFFVLFAPPAVAKWWQQTTFYEIFVRSFQDSDGDGVGDFNGITSRLDYLRDLGIKGIWLMPTFPTPSYHGYDITDFKAVNPEFGTLGDFKRLVREAHQRDIKIILDLVVNHTSDRHPWFQNPNTRDRYVWSKSKPHWGNWYLKGNEYYYSVFDRTMPNLNWRNPEVPAAVKDLMRYWMDQGVDGFRLDAARYYVAGPNGEPDTPETHAAIEDFTAAMRAEFPQVLFVGEIWTDSKTTYSYCENGKELDLAFNFPLAFSLPPSLNSEDVGEVLRGLREYQSIWKKSETAALFLSNHDTTRIASVLYEYTPKLKLAADIYFTLPGTPFLYYGEEIGMPNGLGAGDYSKRMPMQWMDTPGYGFSEGEPWATFYGEGGRYSVDAQLGKNESLLEHYRRLIHFRNRTPLIAQGALDGIYSPGQHVVVWKRTLAGEHAVVVANFSHLPSQSFMLDPTLGPFSEITAVLYGAAEINTPRNLHVPGLPAHSLTVFQVK